ncbi:MAG: aspartate carbamoyltransferase regulatory subunit [Chlamydiae bacterium CG10_big_fil_rev_8_21_14_0_10_42_34]|nr:MAG: aspartate carbamoyltransferase regulatory subunit [Chlamydiae bacterium CG10_big_fil_rev_8_21_14_0_10_42_34]
MIEKTLCVSAICHGTVIDHIKAGEALKIIRVLQLNADGNTVTVGLNLKSQSLGIKDLIKVENVFLSKSQADHIAIFSPTATINVIQNYKLTKKFGVEMPEIVDGILACPNPRCIANLEQIPTSFSIDGIDEDLYLCCKYCEKMFTRDQIHERIYF